MRNIKALLAAFIILFMIACKNKKMIYSKESALSKPLVTEVSLWLTNADKSSLFEKQKASLIFKSDKNVDKTIVVDTSISYQTIDGFGYTLTDGSAALINNLPENYKESLLKELFDVSENNIGVSYLRISIGASDLSASPYTFDDIDVGKTDVNLQNFKIDQIRNDLVPILKKIIAINPSTKILGSPWTAPPWMKTNNSFKGGSLKPEYYQVYAQYLLKFIKAMNQEGINIEAITPQNEPLHGGNVPSMIMTAAEQTSFIKNNLGPLFKREGIKTKIIIYDHNADKPEYPIQILNDPSARSYIDGSAFHLYAGNISALSKVRNAYPDKGIYFTEQWVGGPGNFAADLKWHTENLIIGATRNWSKNVLEWNLAADPDYKPHTDGGCTTCLGALTINNSAIKNVSYYIIAHASKFVRPGSVRIASNLISNLPNVAFKTPNGSKVLIVLNNSDSEQKFDIQFKDKFITTALKSGSVGTYTW